MDPSSMKEEQQVQPKRCSNNCGFFANPNCGDMCSKCSREVQASQVQAAKAIAATAPQPPLQPIAQQQADPPVPAVSPVAAAAVTQPAAPIAQPAAQPALESALQPSPTAAAAPAPSANTTVLAAASAAAVLAPAAAAAAAAAEILAPSAPEVEAPTAMQTASADALSALVAAGTADDNVEPPRRVQKHMNRCFSCNKKVGLTGFKCRCGFVFCGPHRLAEAHTCDFDYKSTGREHLAKANPLIQADRVQRF